ncbi:UDP-3-O-(3-hydroxymyristoyl)glucosamine N-acyltransferase [bacterium]|nr:UDP-3-O-(3-hydroxymyristoyl)glucosamine N-acyltransferase [bacterium]
MQYTLQKLSELLGLEYTGNGSIVITHACGLEKIGPGGVAYLTNPKEMANLPAPTGIFDGRRRDLDDVEVSPEAAIIVSPDITSSKHNLLISDDPMAHHVEVTLLLHEKTTVSCRVHEDAFIGKGVLIGHNVTIDPKAVIYDNVSIGDNTVIRSGTVVMEKSVIGKNCLIHPNVTIREHTLIGNNVILHPGVVLGADGYGFFQRDGLNLKIPQIGQVVIEDDVEIGSCTTIDRARFCQTIIRKGCKIDNLVHIAHNVDLGEHSLVTAQSGIAGSTVIGHHLMMGGQSGIRDNLKIGNNVTLLARTLITSKTDDNAIVAGMPSRPLEVWRKIQALINGLDSLFERIKKVERSVAKMMK